MTPSTALPGLPAVQEQLAVPASAAAPTSIQPVPVSTAAASFLSSWPLSSASQTMPFARQVSQHLEASLSPSVDLEIKPLDLSQHSAPVHRTSLELATSQHNEHTDMDEDPPRRSASHPLVCFPIH